MRFIELRFFCDDKSARPNSDGRKSGLSTTVSALWFHVASIALLNFRIVNAALNIWRIR